MSLIGSVTIRHHTPAQPELIDADSIPEPAKLLGNTVVSLNFASWNQVERWFRDVDGLRRVA
jgi:hypothetical protein